MVGCGGVTYAGGADALVRLEVADLLVGCPVVSLSVMSAWVAGVVVGLGVVARGVEQCGGCCGSWVCAVVRRVVLGMLLSLSVSVSIPGQ